MGAHELLLVGVAIGVPLAVLAAVILTLYRLWPWQVDRTGITIERVPSSELEQYEARTPAGPAIITKVVDDRGPAYEIETSFHGERTRLHYVPPAMARVRYILNVRVAAYLTEREARR